MDPAMSDGIVAHMNDDHADAVLLYARVFGGCPAATSANMTAIDATTMTLAVTTPDGEQIIDVPLTETLETGQDARRVLIKMVRAARERIGGA
ncbi:MAG: DUF2470 domain-containing protein [Pseudomonadota bacterium]